MESSGDQFTCTELSDEVDQENIHSTVSELLENSLDDGESTETHQDTECQQTVRPESSCKENPSTAELIHEEKADAVLPRCVEGEGVKESDPCSGTVEVPSGHTSGECNEAVASSSQKKSVEVFESSNAEDPLQNSECSQDIFKDASGQSLSEEKSVKAAGPLLEEKSVNGDDIVHADVEKAGSIDPPPINEDKIISKKSDSSDQITSSKDASIETCGGQLTVVTNTEDNCQIQNEQSHTSSPKKEDELVEGVSTNSKVNNISEKLNDEGSFPLKKKQSNSFTNCIAEVADNSSFTPSAVDVQKTARNLCPSEKDAQDEPSIEDWNKIEELENKKKDDTSSKKKQLRVPSKPVKYTEVNSSPEKLSDDNGDGEAATVAQVRNKPGRPPGTSKIKPLHELKPLKVESSPNLAALQKNVNRVEECDEAEVSLFVPEGWVFFVSKRMSGPKTTYFDLYYVTPPPRVKIRSRIELKKYMAAKRLKYDPAKFFLKKDVPILLKKGLLVEYKEKYLVQASTDEAVLTEVVKPHVRTTLESLKTKPNQLVKRALKRSVQGRGGGLVQKIKKRSSFTKSKDLKVPECVRHESIEEDDNNVPEKQTRSRPPEEKSDYPTKLPRGRPPKKQVSSLPSNSGRDIQHMDVISFPKKTKRGRPRKSTPAALELPSPLEPTAPVEVRGRLRIRPSKKSPYFSNVSKDPEKNKNVAAKRREKSDPPPRSPYNLIQEDLFHDPWQLLISTIFLNSTSGRLAIPLTLEFLKRWPTPELARQAKVDDILDVIEPLGFGRTRAAIILRFSHEYLTKEWKLPSELYGIGEYGNDSYKIFCLKNAWKTVHSDDPMLMMYLNWRRATEHLRKRFLHSSSSSKSVDPDDLYPSIVSSAPPVKEADASQKSAQSRSPPRKKLRTRASTK